MAEARIQPNYRLVGTRVPRHDAIAKSRGLQRYSDDIDVTQMLYAKVKRSDYPAAILRKVDTSKAKALPGVKAVLTAEDVPVNAEITKFGQMRDVGGGFEGLYKALASGKVRWKGDPIAIVAAETEEIAEAACDLIEIDYDVQPGVFDPREAMKKDAYLVTSEDDSNVIMETNIISGDVDAAWDECDVIVESKYYTSPHDHAYLETESGIGWMDDNGVVTLRVGTQVLEHFRTIAKVIGTDHIHMRNMSCMMGGGFGGKEDITVETHIALLVKATGRPVKLVWNREESHQCHSKRNPEYLHYKTGAKKDGTLVAQSADVVMDGGAYTLCTPWVHMYSTYAGMGPFVIPNTRMHVTSCFTNNTSSSANRGFGGPQVNFAYNRQMYKLAKALDMPMYELLLKNVVHNGDPIPSGYIPEGYCAMEEVLRGVYKQLESKPKVDRLPDGRKVGRGIAVGHMVTGRMTFLHDSSRVSVRLELDGTVTVRAGVPDLGAGQASSIAQICAEEFGLDITDVMPFIMDTHLTPLCGTTTATRQLYMSGNATLKACKIMKERLLDEAEKLMGIPADQLRFGDHRIYFRDNADTFMPFVEVVNNLSNDGGELECIAQFNAPFSEVPDLLNIRGRVNPDMTYTAKGFEVAVDEETGQAEILRMVIGADAGRCLNRNSYEGQLEGGAVYHSLWATTEDLAWINGIATCNNYDGYLLPTTVDVPELEDVVLESGGGLGPYGAKGIGEPSDNDSAPAMINAIADAVGVDMNMNYMPVSPEKVLWAIKGKSMEYNRPDVWVEESDPDCETLIHEVPYHDPVVKKNF